MLPISQMCGVMNAWNTGAEIQIRPSIIKQPWQSCDCPTWDWDHYEYRIKPEPIHVVCYAVLQNGSHDGFFLKRSMAEQRCMDLRGIGRECAIVELKGTYTCDT